MVALGVLFLSLAAIRLGRGVSPVTGTLMWGAILLAIIGSGFVLFFSRPSRAEAAESLDLRGDGVADRFKTWLALSKIPANADWKNAVRAEIQAFAVNASFDRAAPVRFGRLIGALAMVLCGVVIFQLAFYFDMNANRHEREISAELLAAAAEDVESSALDAPDLATKLQDEADRLASTSVDDAREAAVRALADAIAQLRAMGVATSQTSDGGGVDGAAGSAKPASDGEAAAATQGIPVTQDPSAGQGAGESDEDRSRRLDRLASRLEDRKREASGMADQAERGDPSDGDGDGQAGQSLLDQLAAGQDPAAPGPVDSGASAPGPGSDQDFGESTAGAAPDVVGESAGPELGANVPEGVDGGGSGFSIVSRESSGNATRAQQIGGIQPAEFSEQAMALEDIPPGARVLVRRYFESLQEPER